MITRTTSAMRVDSAMRNLQTTAAGLAKLQNQAASQKAITKPSDDPVATAETLKIHSAQKANVQFSRNANDATAWLSSVDASLTSTTSLIGRARVLTVQGANDGASSPAAKEAIALELDSIKGELLKEANTKFMGRNIFNGNSNAGQAFTPDYSYTSGQGSVERRVGEGTVVRVDADGAAVFGEGEESLFALIDNIAADLRANVNVGPRLLELDDRLQTVLGAQAKSGSRLSTVIDAQSAIATQKVELESQRAAVEDIDTAEIIMELQMQDLVYQSALSVTANSLSKTLMDFIR